jgi:hypothetical protein
VHVDSEISREYLYLQPQGGANGKPNLHVVSPDQVPLVKRNNNNELVVSGGTACLQVNMVRLCSTSKIQISSTDLRLQTQTRMLTQV